MGVPLFVSWLKRKYPKIISEALGEKGEPVAELEFDNLYLDLNEIIHSCFPSDDELFSSLCQRIDRLFNIVRPRKLLFMAIDGVAPRTKMLLIRAGRYRCAEFNGIAEEMKVKLREQFEKEGKSLLPEEELQIADPNVVTPGTEFMHMLSKKLQSYISWQMSENPAWENIKVILSDDKVPGEGEHKIMSFIRAQRSSPGYDPNTRHCVHGMDADIIMLALATHEVHFSNLREDPLWDVDKRKVCQFLNVCVLREYLALDLKIPSSDKFECDLERIIDDFIFICFFAGNDFLRRMPPLETHERCFDLLMHIYKKEFHNFGGYLVDMQKVEDKIGGCINLKGVERFILAVGAYEDKIFSKRSQLKERQLRRILAENRDKDNEENHLDDGRASDILASNAAVADDEVLRNTVELKQEVEDYIGTQYDLFLDGLGIDKVKFGTPGWRERYYKEKFSAQTPDEIEATRKTVVAKYGEGLCWVLLCYFSGVPSWSWFYPYKYGPLASDMKGLSQINVEFHKDLPLKPFDQLLAVLSPRSAHLLPEAYRELMVDKNSKIIDFYPTEFEEVIDGKRYPYQGLHKLPFIEEERLLTETRKLENDLKDHEKIRNSHSLDLLFVRRSSEAGQQVLCCGTRAASMKIEGAIMMDSAIEGIKGTLHVMPEDLIEADDDNKSRNVLRMFHEIPQGFRHVPQLLEGVNIPQKMVNEEDIRETILWHEYCGSYSNRFQNRRPIQPDQKLEYGSRNTAPAFMSQGGCGFSSDRGKTSAACRLDSPDHFPKHAVSKPVGELKPEEHTSSGLRPNYGTRYHPPSEHNWRSKEGSSRRDEYGGKHAVSGPVVGELKREENMSSSLRPNYGTRGHQPSEHNWRSKEGSSRRDEYGGKHAVSGPVVGELKREENVSSSLRPNYGTRRHQQPEYDGRSEAGCSRRDNYGGIERLGKSDMSPRPMSNNRPRQESSNFWQSRSGVTYGANDDWNLNKLSRAAPGDTWQKTQHPNESFSSNTGRGRGRGCN